MIPLRSRSSDLMQGHEDLSIEINVGWMSFKPAASSIQEPVRLRHRRRDSPPMRCCGSDIQTRHLGSGDPIIAGGIGRLSFLDTQERGGV